MKIINISTLPEPPHWFNKDQSEYWYQFGSRLIEMNSLTNADIYLLELLAERWADYRRATKENEKITIVFTQCLTLLKELGLTPKERQKLNIKEDIDVLENIINS